MKLGCRSRVLLVTLGGMLAWGGALGTAPAMAKGEHRGPPHPSRCPVGGDPYCPAGHVTITGPGLEGPVTIGGRDFWTVQYLTGAGYRPYGYAEPSPPATSALGPRYRATYVVKPVHGPTQSMTQDLYPYASGLVWAFTPGGQRFQSDLGVFTTLGGWWHSSALLDVLTAHGLPAHPPGGSAAANHSSAAGVLAGPASAEGGSGHGRGGPDGGTDGAGGPVGIGIAALAALLVAAAVGARPRRSMASEVWR